MLLKKIDCFQDQSIAIKHDMEIDILARSRGCLSKVTEHKYTKKQAICDSANWIITFTLTTHYVQRSPKQTNKSGGGEE